MLHGQLKFQAFIIPTFFGTPRLTLPSNLTILNRVINKLKLITNSFLLMFSSRSSFGKGIHSGSVANRTGAKGYPFPQTAVLPGSDTGNDGVKTASVAYAEICKGGGGCFGAENLIALSSPGNGQKLPKLGLHSKIKCFGFKNILQ